MKSGAPCASWTPHPALGKKSTEVQEEPEATGPVSRPEDGQLHTLQGPVQCEHASLLFKKQEKGAIKVTEI